MNGHLMRQYSDAWVCRFCGETFDVNEPELPQCKGGEDGRDTVDATEEVVVR